MKKHTIVKSTAVDGSLSKTYSFFEILPDGSLGVAFIRLSLADSETAEIYPDFFKVKAFKNKVLMREVTYFKYETLQKLIDGLNQIIENNRR